MRRGIQLLLVFAVVLDGILLGVLITRHLSFKRNATETVKREVVALTSQAATDIDRILRHAMSLADSMAADLTSGKLEKNGITERLYEVIQGDQSLMGVLVAFEPYQFSASERLYAPSVRRVGQKIELFRVDASYDYTTSESARYYQNAVRSGAQWSEPFFGRATSKLNVMYAAPFFRVDPSSGTKQPLGIVGASVSLENIQKIIDRLDLGPSGYGGLISRNGVYLYHPIQEYVREQKTIQDVARATNDKDRLLIAEKAKAGEQGILDHRSTTTGQAAWLVFQPIPATGWTINNTFIRDDIYINVDILRRQLMRIVLSAVCLAVFLLPLLIRGYDGSSRKIWFLSIATGLAFLVGIGCIWNLALSYGNHKKREGVKILDRKSLDNYLGQVNSGQRAQAALIPTGISLQSLEFRGANTVTCTGYIWQKYDGSVPGDLTRDFLLPDAIDEVKVKEAYRLAENGSEVIGWFFMATLRQRLKYFTYPLDQESIAIEIAHKQLNRNVMLVPDIDSYRLLNPSTLPGIRADLELKGWSLVRSYFAYNTVPLRGTYGIRSLADRDVWQKFSYNVEVKRNFIDIFISKLIPLIMIAIMLYATLMMISRNEDLFRFANPVAARILQFCAAMFFIIIFAHIDTRTKIDADKIFYLEYFYFVMYVFLLYVSLTAILFAMNRKATFIQYRDSFISKVMFWPVLLGSLLLITFGVFY